MKQLGEVINIIKGNKTDNVYDYQPINGIRYLQIEDLRPNTSLKYTVVEKPTLALETDVVIAWDGANAGTVGFNLNGHIGSTLAILRPKNKEIYAPYLGYYLGGKFDYLQETATGATIPHVNRVALEEIFVPLPPLDEQKRIAARLGKADRLRRLRRYALDVSEGYLQSLFLDMFGDPATNPMGWDTAYVSDVADVQGGLQLGSQRSQYSLLTPYLRVANVYRNRLDLTEIKMLPVLESEIEKTKLERGDVLFVEGHGNINEIGRGAIWDGSIENCVHQNHLIRARIRQENTSSVYFSHFLNSNFGQEYFRSRSNTTSGLNTITVNIVRECPILLPNENLQFKFERIVKSHNRLRAQQREALRQAEHLFQTLLHQAFDTD